MTELSMNNTLRNTSKWQVFSFLVICVFYLIGCQEDANSSTNNHKTKPVKEETTTKTNSETLETKVRDVLGQAMSLQLTTYRNQLKSIKTVEDVAKVYEQGIVLRDTLVEILGKYTDNLQQDSLPDLFWLKESMPTHQPQLVAEGTSYYLFSDYKKWLDIVKRSPAQEDDEFMALNLMLFPEDSIEYFYPAWFIQTWDYGGSSLLGRRIHQHILQKATDILPKISQPIFKKEILAIKDHIINDILSSETTYWERKSVVLVELDAIIKLKYAILSENDIIALQKRRHEFNEPDKYGIKLNQQSGM